MTAKKGKTLWKRIWQNREAYLMIAPFFVLFAVFTVLPVLLSLPVSLTDFDLVNYPPDWVGLDNFYNLFTNDPVFLKSIRVTLIFALFAGVFGFVMSFLLAWMINGLSRPLRVFFTLLFYAPSMTAGGVAVWQLIFSGDNYGILNSFLLNLGIIDKSVQWLTDSRTVLFVVILVQLWSSMGAGFLAMRAGLQNIDPSYYEAAAIEGMRSRFQELWYITIPAMAPSLMFAAIMQIVSAFTVDATARALVGFPSTDYAAHTLMTHAYDYGWVRFEMGYAAAVCLLLFVLMFAVSRVVRAMLSKYMD